MSAGTQSDTLHRPRCRCRDGYVCRICTDIAVALMRKNPGGVVLYVICVQVAPPRYLAISTSDPMVKAVGASEAEAVGKLVAARGDVRILETIPIDVNLEVACQPQT